MAVSLPTAADVRKAREQAAHTVAERAGVVRTPLLAALGAGDFAVAVLNKAIADVRGRAATAPGRVTVLPQRITTDEVRRIVADVRTQAEIRYAELSTQVEQVYTSFAEHGEETWGRIRTQPQVQQAIATLESYTEKLDTTVDTFVDDASGAAERTLRVVTRQTRVTGEKVAQATQRVAGRAAETVTEAGLDATEVVSETIAEAGDDAAAATRSTTRKAANRTAPKVAPKPTARKAPPRAADEPTDI